MLNINFIRENPDKVKKACQDKGIEVDVDQLLEMALEKEAPIDELCNAIFENYQQGLKLVKEKTGNDGFMITKEAIRNPEGFLNKLIKESYEN